MIIKTKSILIATSSIAVLLAACGDAGTVSADVEDAATEKEKMEKGAKTLEEAADRAMQVEIDALNNVEPESTETDDPQDLPTE